MTGRSMLHAPLALSPGTHPRCSGLRLDTSIEAPGLQGPMPRSASRPRGKKDLRGNKNQGAQGNRLDLVHLLVDWAVACQRLIGFRSWDARWRMAHLLLWVAVEMFVAEGQCRTSIAERCWCRQPRF